MKILLTGANGFVGARIRAAAPVICAPSLRGAEKEDIDRLIDTVQPDAILHTAAISDIGACAKDPEGSYHANVLVAGVFSQSRKRCEARVVQLRSGVQRRKGR